MDSLNFWPTREGLHIVSVSPDGDVRFVGILWGIEP